RGVETVVGGHQRHGLYGRVELAPHFDRAGEVVVGSGQRAENVLVAARVDLPRRTATLHHRDLEFFRNRTVIQRVVAGEGPEQEVHLVLADQLYILLHAEADIGLIVEEVERQLVGR